MTLPILDDLPYIEWTPKGGGIKRIYADAWMQEGIDSPADVTEHALESGSRVNDHYQRGQLTGTVQLFFSEEPIRGDLGDVRGNVESFELSIPPYPNNTPLLSPRGLTQAVATGVNTLGDALGLGGVAGPPNAQALRFPSAPGRLRSAFEQLVQLQDDATLVAIGFTVIRAENLALINVRISRTREDGSGGTIEIEVRQLAFTSTQSAAALPIPLEPRGQQKKDSVTVSAEDVPEGPKKTAAKSLFDSARGAL